ncbi:hypothetical protein RvY_17401 [Ramazzottius varieornatus]|uniref:MARVEL domain-containing protein n=1 Tax=Ramazzottius varieornatus TaxID=947166 RepID=A0A1D1W1Z6_RAMVA|nr:hypothetical protein RvY_17401 [Ramazzottius varieornatus]
MGLVFSRGVGQPRFNPGYLKGLGGVLKVLEVVFALIAFILAFSGYFNYGYFFNSAGWVKFATGVAWISSFLWLIMYMCNMYPWLLYEAIFDFILAAMLLIAGAVMIRGADFDSTRGACVFFCWAAMIVYIIDGIYNLRLRRSGVTNASIGSGNVVTTTQTTVIKT